MRSYSITSQETTPEDCTRFGDCPSINESPSCGDLPSIGHSAKTIENGRTRASSYFEDYFDEEEEEEIPSFVTEKMSKNDLFQRFCEILHMKFEPMAVSIYLIGLERTDFLNCAMMMNGMLSLRRYDVFRELTGLWGYYLTLQDDPDFEARLDIFEIINSRKQYFSVLNGLLEICKQLSILSANSKTIIIHKILRYLEKHDVDLMLSMKNLEYLFDYRREEVFEKFSKTAIYPRILKSYDIMSFDVAAFHNYMTN